jgi:steroid delta-isomerase-like uncharacterized protein
MTRELRIGERSASVANKILARRAIEDVFVGGDLSLIPDLFARDVVVRMDRSTVTLRSRDALKRHLERRHEALTERKITVQETLADDGRVVVRGTFRARHTGTIDVPGRGRFPPTGRVFSVPVVYAFTIEDGGITEVSGLTDTLSIAEQLGLAPTSPLDFVRTIVDVIREGFIRSGD